MVSANHTTGNRPLSISPCYWNGPHMDRENIWPWWQLKFVYSYIVILVVSAIQQSGFLRPHFRYSHLRLWEWFWTAEERRMLTSLPSNCWRHEVSSILVLQPVTICNRDFFIFCGTRTVCVERFTATISSAISQFVCFVAVAWDWMGVFWFSSARQTMRCSLFYLWLYQCLVFHRSRPTARGNFCNRPALCESERWIARPS